MNTALPANNGDYREAIPVPDKQIQPAPVKFLAGQLSYIFHPVFIPVYVSWFLVYRHAYLFSGFDKWDKTVVLLQFFVTYSFFPIIITLLLKALGFIDSIYLKTQKDRIIPYIVCGMFYFSIWYVMKNQLRYPDEITVFGKAVFFAATAGLLINIFQKISMHAMAMGVMSTFIFLLAINDNAGMTLYLSIAVLITGLVCTSRLIVTDHSPKEIYTGLLAGIASQLLAYYLS